MDQAPFFWNEVVPRGSIQQTSISVSWDSMSAVMNFYVKWPDLKTAILYIMGSALVSIQNPSTPSVSCSLQRFLPAKHPRFPHLRATRILSIHGRGGQKNQTWKGIQSGQGWYGDWNVAEFSVLFESPRFSMGEDSEVTAEYQRHCLRSFDTNVEMIARRGEDWFFLDPKATAVSAHFPGDLIIRQPKGMLRWYWYGIPEDWIMLGKLIPSNLLSGTGCVNAFPFPKQSFGNDLTAGQPVQMPSGTLLLLPVKITPKTQVTSSVLKAKSAPNFPRTYDVELDMVYFNPPTDDATTVSIYNDDGSLNTNVAVRGHNLAPMRRSSSTKYRFYAVARKGYSGNVDDDQNLLYRYYDFERLFSWPRSKF